MYMVFSWGNKNQGNIGNSGNKNEIRGNKNGHGKSQ
jgi:hypothetical protein